MCANNPMLQCRLNLFSFYYIPISDVLLCTCSTGKSTFHPNLTESSVLAIETFRGPRYDCRCGVLVVWFSRFHLRQKQLGQFPLILFIWKGLGGNDTLFKLAENRYQWSIILTKYSSHTKPAVKNKWSLFM